MKPEVRPALTLPSALAFILLAAQASIPWIAGHYLTQDGPSHLYNAIVFRNLLLHPHGLYASIYRFQPRLVSNWAIPLLLGPLEPLVGAAHAEAALSTLSVLLAFAAVTYFRRAIDGEKSRACDPLTNFLINSWFLWSGFYNFYLGMALCLALIGYYLRRAKSFSLRHSIVLALGLAGLFFVHALPAALAILAIFFAALWTHRSRLALPALAPALILLAIFARHGASIRLESPLPTLRAFPMHAFASAHSFAGQERLLALMVLLFLAAGLAAMSRSEWRTPRAALFAAAIAIFLACLMVPDYAFGGNGIKLRLAWAVFLFGCPAAASVARLQRLRTPLSVAIACLLVPGLVDAARNMRNAARAADAYYAVLAPISEGSTFVRLRYPSAAAQATFHYDLAQLDPLLHADSWAASRRGALDLSDPFAASRVFPVGFRKEFSGEQQTALWNMEDAGLHGTITAMRVLEATPVRIGYLVLTGRAEPPPELRPHLSELPGGNNFVRVYLPVFSKEFTN